MAIMCPLLSNPKVAEKFNQIKDVVGEVGAYDIWSKNNGNSIDMAPNGEPSILFQDLLMVHGGMIAGAIESKAKIFTKNFIQKFGDWFNMDTIFQDENREPISEIIEKHLPEDLIDYYANFVGKLKITKNKLRSKKYQTDNYIDFIISYDNYVSELTGEHLFSKQELENLDTDSLKLDDVYNRIDYLCQNLPAILQKHISEYKEKIDDTHIYSDWYTSNMLSFLRKNTTDISDYDPITQRNFRNFFPNIFKEGITEAQRNKYFGFYKHQLMSKKGKAYSTIQAVIQSNNIYRYSLISRYNKLRKIAQLIDITPDLQTRIKNKLYNQFAKQASLYGNKEEDLDLDYKQSKNNLVLNFKPNVDFVRGLIKKENSIDNLVNIVYNFTPEGVQKQYIGRLLDTLKRYTKGKAYFFKLNDKHRNHPGVCIYDNHGQLILLGDTSSNYTHISNTIIHEAVHYVTSRYVDEHPRVNAVLQGYIDYLKQYDEIHKSNFFDNGDPNGFENSHEFLAEFVSNPEFRELLKHVPAYDEQEFNNALENVVSIIDKSIHNNAHDQIENVVLQILDNNGYTFDQSESNKNKVIRKFADKSANITDLIDSEETEVETEKQQNDAAIRTLNRLQQNEEEFIVKAVREKMQQDPNSDLMGVVNDARYKFAEEQQSRIIQSTQLRLAEAFGLHKQEDGTWKTANGKDSLLVQFFEYLDDADGYYDYNTKSSMAHHVIGIGLNSADPSTFNHEMAHHYLRMFWRSKLVQTALKAVDKEGMTDVQREEALVDLLTMKTMDNQFLDYAHNDSFFAHFWTKFGSMLYSTFNVKSKLTRNALLNNMAIAFAINEQQKMNERQHQMFEMANQRMFKKKQDVKLKMKEAKKQGFLARNNPEYQALLGDKTQSAIKNIIQGVVSRNKSYRKTSENPIVLMNMQLAEDEVRKFVNEIALQRNRYKATLNKSRLSASDKRNMSHTPEELKLNIKLIKSFAEKSYDDIEELINILYNSELGKYKRLCYIEHINPNTGETQIEYLDISHENDPNVQIKEITLKDLQEYKANTIDFYRNVVAKLNRALADPYFELYYGKDVREQLLDILKGTQSQVGVETLISNCEQLYQNAIEKHVYNFVDDYVDKHVKLDDDMKERMKYSMHTWLEDQNVFGDVNIFETWFGLSQHSESPVIRMLGDIIMDMVSDRNKLVKKRGDELNKLRQKAIEANGGKWKEVIRNVEKMFMETDENGFTGNWTTEVNSGKFYGELNKFLNVLLQGKGGIEQQIADRIGDSRYELTFDETGEIEFPSGCEDIEKKYRHKLNEWYSQHAVRRFTYDYYEARINMLSSFTIKAQREIDNEINSIRKSLPEGPTRTDLLPASKQRELIRLERQKAQLSSIYYINGQEKPIGTIERQIADELSAWQMFIKDKIKYKLDEDSYKAAYDHAANKQLFEQNNTYLSVNPKIWDAVAKIFGNRTSNKLEELTNNRRKLLSIVKLKGVSFPNIEAIFDLKEGKIRSGYEEFFENLKQLDVEIAKERNIISKGNKATPSQVQAYNNLLGKIQAQYTDSNGLRKPWIQKIEQYIQERYERLYPGDPNNKYRVEKDMQMFSYKDGNKTKYLSLFTVTAPTTQKVYLDGEWVDSFVRQPTQLYSKLDSQESDPMWVDTRFDENDKNTIQPFTDKTTTNNISYTNKVFDEIKNNKDLFAYYSLLKQTVEEAWSQIPFLHTYDNRLPQIGATTRQFGWRHPFSIGRNFMYMINRNYCITEKDTDINNDFELRPDGTRSMNIPVRYIQRLADPSSISGDLFGSVMKFYEMALNYKEKTEKLPLFQSIYNKLKSNKSLKDRQRKVVRGIINRQFYDRRASFDFDDDNPAVYNSMLSKRALKAIPIVKELAQTGLLAMSAIAGTVNYLDPFMSVLVESFCGKYMTFGEWLKGTAAAICSIPSQVASIGSSRCYAIGNGYNMIPTAMNYFGIYKEGSRQFERSDKTILNKLLSPDMLMSPFSLGEYMIGTQVMGITFEQFRYYDGKFYSRDEFINEMVSSGQMTRDEAVKEFRRMRKHTLYGAYEAKDGTLVPRNNEYGNAITKELERKIEKLVKNRISTYLLKPDPTETTKMQSNLITSMVLIMRTFMLVGAWERYKGGRDFQIEDDTLYEENEQGAVRKRLKNEYTSSRGMYNFQTDMVESGSTRRAVDNLIHIFSKKSDYKYLRYLKWAATHPFVSQYSEETQQVREQLDIADVDVYSGKRLATEMFFITALIGASIIFHNKVALDDPDDWTVQFIDLILMRLGIERMTMLNFDTLMELITSITAAKSDWDKKGYIINLFKDIIFRINNGQWEYVTGYGVYQHKPKVFRDLMYCLNSLGTHNIYSTLNVIGLKQKIKWYKNLAPGRALYDDVKLRNQALDIIKEMNENGTTNESAVTPAM